ncbi:MAG: hypothetical protein WAK96_01265 [Desulfobaccales bacterium]
MDHFLGGWSLLRVYCKYDRKLLKDLGHCARESPEISSRMVLSLDER